MFHNIWWHDQRTKSHDLSNFECLLLGQKLGASLARSRVQAYLCLVHSWGCKLLAVFHSLGTQIVNTLTHIEREWGTLCSKQKRKKNSGDIWIFLTLSLTYERTQQQRPKNTVTPRTTKLWKKAHHSSALVNEELDGWWTERFQSFFKWPVPKTNGLSGNVTYNAAAHLGGQRGSKGK